MADIDRPDIPGPGPELDSVELSSGYLAALTDANDRLVRGVFHVGLRLHTLSTALTTPGASTAAARSARATVADTFDDLDRFVRDAGLTMLPLATRSILPGPFDAWR
ncbi:hypothetical protein [Nocardia blacklockiae]|uniref:hypothetical protein n=1 Tax=Nocardia blacklockiae TaxID=480036 RepID=UPI0018942914|nr:hypothetical protein [Nocardia blacklockiae]MBF6169938.1 hypothetical protein [Nocardia blacklockiae]